MIVRDDGTDDQEALIEQLRALNRPSMRSPAIGA
jgi:hypothetical protein